MVVWKVSVGMNGQMNGELNIAGERMDGEKEEQLDG